MARKLANVRRASKTPLAVQDDGALLTPGPVRDRLLDEAKRVGARDIRANVIWGQVRNGHSYDFSKYDDLVNTAAKRGLRVQMTLMGTPRYMPQEEQELSWRSPDAKLMGQFAADVANHFKGRVGRYSVWNEPNYQAFLEDQKNAPLNYRRLYQAGYKGVKGIDPKAQVLLGELMPGDPKRRANDPAQALTFLRNVLKRGDRALLTDGVAVHPYQWFSPNQKVRGRGASTYAGIGNLPRVQQVLAQQHAKRRLATPNGARAPLYLTEYGYKRASVPNEHKRAAWLGKSYRLAQQGGAKQFLQYQLAPSRSSPGSPAQDAVVGAYGQVVRPARAAGPTKPAGSWDTSIANDQGQILNPYVRALRRRRR